MNRHDHLLSSGWGATSLAFLVLLVLLAACGTGNDESPQVAPAAENPSAPETTAENKTIPGREITLTPTPGAAGMFDCAAVTQIPTAECAALVALYNSTNGPGWVDNNDWLVTNTPCTWTGIGCTDGHASQIHLSYNRLRGLLPPELSDLAHLQVLELGSNQLRGPIPGEWGDLSELVSLSLWGNQLNGHVPAELGKLGKLQSLTLARNQIKGFIPPALGEIKSLELLDLSFNQLTGPIPDELGDLPRLQLLYLSHNQLGGAIPAAFDNLSKLTELDLTYNQLHGPLRESITRIDQPMLWGNRLEGTIPIDGQKPAAVDYWGVHFTADPSLATSIWPEVKPATPRPEVADGPSYWLAIPVHIRFTFSDPDLSLDRRRMGFHLAAEGQVLVFPLAELANMNLLVQAQIETLRDLLAQKGNVPEGELPLLPLTNSAQVFHAQAVYFDLENIQGLRFISQHSQDPAPIVLSQALFYTVQGFTKDDAYYVAVFFPLTTEALPDTIEVEDWEAFHANYDTYLSETTAVLDQLPPIEFTPDLTLLDALAASLRIDPGIEAYAEPVVVEPLPLVDPLDLSLDPQAGLIAYQ